MVTGKLQTNAGKIKQTPHLIVYVDWTYSPCLWTINNLIALFLDIEQVPTITFDFKSYIVEKERVIQGCTLYN